MKIRLQAFISIVFTLITLIVIIIGIAAYNSFYSFLDKAYWVAHTNQVIDTSEKLLSFLKDAETGQRGYLLSGDSIYLEPYFSSLDSIPSHLQSLKYLTEDNLSQVERITSLQAKIMEKLAFLEEGIALRQKANQADLASFIASKKSKIKMDEIRFQIASIIGEEKKLLQERSKELNQITSITQLIIYSVIVFSFVIALLSFFYIKNQLVLKEIYEKNLDQLNQDLSFANEELASLNEEYLASNEELSANAEALSAINIQLEMFKEELEKKVQQRTKKLDQILKKLTEEILEHKQTEKTLKLTLQELQERNHEMDNYVYKVSHDLRAPLASILGLINLIEIENDAIQIKQYVKLIKQSINKSDDFIRSVLTHSKIINVAIKATPIDFQKIIEACMEELMYLPNASKISVRTQITGEGIFYSDELRLTTILKNIISNAIKYMNSRVHNSYLYFIINFSREKAVINIEDNGIGIEKQYVDKVFNMFFRATEKSNGSGLGLYIVKQTVEKLNGNINLESREGVGTQFSIFLPNLVKSYVTK